MLKNFIYFSEINKVLSHWKKLRVLHMTMDKEITGFNLNEHFLLRKIIIPRSIPLEDLDDWAMSKKIWLDPKDYSSKPQYLIWLPNISQKMGFWFLKFSKKH